MSVNENQYNGDRHNGNQYGDIDDKALIALCTGGDAAAFEALVYRYEKKIVAAACRLSGSREEGEDLAQETFIKAWRALAGYRGQASFGAWLTAILTNLWRDRLRRHKASQISIDEAIEGEEGSIYKQIRDDAPGPEVLTESAETNEILDRMIQALKPEFREALILRDVQGFSYEEVAVITGSNLGTVKSRINRGRTLMKDMILSYQEHNPGFFRLKKIRADKDEAGKTEGGEAREG